MRFTKFLAATMAAMTIVSCSEQVEDFGTNVQPGDAVLSFRVGTNGGTTYATAAEEAKVNSLIAYLAYKDGKGVTAFKEIKGSASGLTETLADGTFTAGPATLYFVGNMPGASGKTSEADLNKLTDAKVIYTNKSGVLTLDPTGMTVTRKVAIDLKSGPVTGGTPDGGIAFTDGKVALKRLAARVYAESAGDIKDYKVNFTGTTANANLFSYAGAGVGTPPLEYKITGLGIEDQYGKKEAVGYVYPSSADVTINVTNTAGIIKPVTFKPEANKNYKLNITPIKSDGAALNFTVSIEAYKDGSDMNVDFTSGDLIVKTGGTLPAGFRAVGGALVIDKATAAAGTPIALNQLFAETLVRVDPATLALGKDFQISEDKMFASGGADMAKLSFIALHNYGKDVTYTAKFAAWDGKTASTKKIYSMKVTVTGQNLPENFTTKVGGLEFMSVGSQGGDANLATQIQIVNDLNKFTGAKFVDKIIAAVASNASNTAKVIGGRFSSKDITDGNTCPSGFAVPTRAQIATLMGALPATAPAGGILYHSLTAGAEKVIGSTKVGNYKGTPIYNTLSGSAVGDDKLYIPHQSTLAMYGTIGATHTRLTFWDVNILVNPVSANAADASVRCVKVAQTPLS